MTVLTKGQTQKHGRSPLAMLQQNKRDDVRLFFKLESSLLFCADAQQPVLFSRMINLTENSEVFYLEIILTIYTYAKHT